MEGGGGVQARLTIESSDVVFSLLFSVSPQFILQRESSDHGFFKENYHKNVTFRYSMEKGALTFPGGSTFPRWRGSNRIFLYNLWFSRRLGSVLLPPPLDPRVASLTGFVDTSSWPKDLAWHSLHWCKFCAAVVNNDRVLLFSDWRYDWGIKKATSRVVHRVSKAFCAMGYCIIPNVGCEGSLYI